MTTTPVCTEITWTRAELLKAWKDNRVAGMAAVGLTVQFLLNEGTRGIVIQHNGCIKRFQNDSLAWRFIDDLNEESLKHPQG